MEHFTRNSFTGKSARNAYEKYKNSYDLNNYDLNNYNLQYSNDESKYEDDFCTTCLTDFPCDCDETPPRCRSCGEEFDGQHDMCYGCYKKTVWETYFVLQKRLRGQYYIALRIWYEAGFTLHDLKAICSNRPCYELLNKGKCLNPLCLYKHIHRSSDPCSDFLKGHCAKRLGCFKQHKYPRKCRNGQQCTFGKKCKFFHPGDSSPSLRAYEIKVGKLKVAKPKRVV